MFGSNAKGLSNDTAAVATPVVLGQDIHKMGQPAKGQRLLYDANWRNDVRYYWNHTLPYGFFSRSPVEPVTGGLLALSLPISDCFVMHCKEDVRERWLSTSFKKSQLCIWLQHLGSTCVPTFTCFYQPYTHVLRD